MVRLVAALLLCLAAPALAQPVVVSPAPEAVSVTVYRDPNRSTWGEMDLKWLGGYALVTETRTVDLPAGPSVIRFEGVAGNILPVSAIVSGLPGRVPEKNYDARLLSPGALVEAFLGRQVHIRRTSRATGKTVEMEAILRSGPDGIVLTTAEGVEALRCTGLPESLVYPGVPADLSDRPTLAVQTETAAPARATLRLSYLAGQFDWQANYVAQLAPDGRTVDLFAWLTLANGNDESFAAARTQAVAGTVDRVEAEGDEGAEPVSPQISLQCWPAGTTSDTAYMVPPPPGPPGEYAMYGADIVVTGARIRHPNLMSSIPITSIGGAELEELGDLKLYRIPDPVTVAANSQKQVGLLSKTRVPVERINAAWLEAGRRLDEPEEAGVVLRTRNVAERNLGLPLPMGPLAIFEEVGGRQMLTGQGAIADSAVGQEVEIAVGASPGVFVHQRLGPKKKKKKKTKKGEEKPDEDEEDDSSYLPGRYELEVSNATPHAVEVEVNLWRRDQRALVRRASRDLAMKNGRYVWRARVPANGRATLAYTYVPAPEDEEED
ncbi:MAG TPA: hypothetical protein VE053_05020 [Allosphingosinicella sp.]|nr:hypothetical protein [Allosphingosinicella sp.]